MKSLLSILSKQKKQLPLRRVVKPIFSVKYPPKSRITKPIFFVTRKSPLTKADAKDLKNTVDSLLKKKDELNIQLDNIRLREKESALSLGDLDAEIIKKNLVQAVSLKKIGQQKLKANNTLESAKKVEVSNNEKVKSIILREEEIRIIKKELKHLDNLLVEEARKNNSIKETLNERRKLLDIGEKGMFDNKNNLEKEKENLTQKAIRLAELEKKLISTSKEMEKSELDILKQKNDLEKLEEIYEKENDDLKKRDKENVFVKEDLRIKEKYLRQRERAINVDK